MYNIKKRRTGMNIKVKDIIAELEKENPEAIFTCCGDNLVFVHVEQDDSVVTIDTEDLHDDPGYEDAMDGDINDIPAIEGESGYYISRQRYWEMLHKVINGIYEQANNEVLRLELMNLDFTKKELDQLCYFNPKRIDLDGTTIPEPTEIDLPRAKELLVSMLDKIQEEDKLKYAGEFFEEELIALGKEEIVEKRNRDNREIACSIIDTFENLLDEKGIIIPSEDERESDEQKATAIFGTEYYNLEDDIVNILNDSPKKNQRPKGKCPIFFENQETKVKLSMGMTLESKEKAEDLKVLEHHIDQLLDLDSHPEIKSVYDVKVKISK